MGYSDPYGLSVGTRSKFAFLPTNIQIKLIHRATCNKNEFPSLVSRSFFAREKTGLAAGWRSR